uniref:Transthyretin-like family protein n=1 Tax=Haemonchus contortus TaxID=6289 RepID=A0A7I4YNB1_HAECO|nr:unnamed protein product [Haemonchus contortus]
MICFPICFVILILLPLCDGLFGIGRMQSVAVEGTLECNGEPARKVKVKLYDKGVLIDKKLDQGRTDSSGWFRLSGSKREISRIDPKLNIYHKCAYHGPCKRKLSLDIPKKFITKGRYPKKTYNIGTLNLASKFKGETIDCIN